MVLSKNPSTRNFGRSRQPIIFLVLLAVADLLLLAPAGSWPRTVGAVVMLLSPGFFWGQFWLQDSRPLLRWVASAGLGYPVAIFLALLLHYVPGPIPVWAELITLDVAALVPILLLAIAVRAQSVEKEPAYHHAPGDRLATWALAALLVVLLVGLAFRFVGLGYSEFQGDEALAMISSAETIEGHADALFLRGKGPAEVLLPAGLWRLSGTTNEAIARTPFALAGILMVVTGYALAKTLLASYNNELIPLITAALLALNGFLVAFSRIVQYQTLVVLMSALALLSTWQWSASGRRRWLAVAGICLGTGLLAHYDAILVVPALIYVFWRGSQSSSISTRQAVSGAIIALLCLVVVAGAFYVPYVLDPQAIRTGGYLGDRIGGGLIKNNLSSFQELNVFYTSAYYYIFTGLLVLGFCGYAIAGGRNSARRRRWLLPATAVVVAAGLWLALAPHSLRVGEVDLAFAPLAIILAAVFFSRGIPAGARALVLWLAVPFLGYNFGVAVPLTHIYTIVPAWVLIASLALSLVVSAALPAGNQRRMGWLWPAAVLAGLALVFGGYLYPAYLRQSVEFRQDWPRSRPDVYWTPYQALPKTGFFGFVHRTGWKGVGSLYLQGSLAGDFNSNEEPDVTAWYTRGALRACGDDSEYFFQAQAVVDAWPNNFAQVKENYQLAGQIETGSDKQLTIYQLKPVEVGLGTQKLADLAPAFDKTAWPEAFARSGRAEFPLDVNLGNLVHLQGYDLDTSRSYPGGRIAVTLYWRAAQSITADYHVFVHLEKEAADGSTSLWGQADGRPVCWTFPTFDWRSGQIIADHHAISIPDDTPAGTYHLRVGMYLPDTGQRLDILGADGTPTGNSINLTTINVQGDSGQ